MEIIQKRFYRKNYPLPKNKQAAPLDSEWRRLVCVIKPKSVIRTT